MFPLDNYLHIPDDSTPIEFHVTDDVIATTFEDTNFVICCHAIHRGIDEFNNHCKTTHPCKKMKDKNTFDNWRMGIAETGRGKTPCNVIFQSSASDFEGTLESHFACAKCLFGPLSKKDKLARHFKQQPHCAASGAKRSSLSQSGEMKSSHAEIVFSFN